MKVVSEPFRQLSSRRAISGAYSPIAGLASALAQYARTSEQIAEERKIDLANLSQINELVIRDMQDGILVVDGLGRIRQSNPRAAQLLERDAPISLQQIYCRWFEKSKKPERAA